MTTTKKDLRRAGFFLKKVKFLFLFQKKLLIGVLKILGKNEKLAIFKLYFKDQQNDDLSKPDTF